MKVGLLRFYLTVADILSKISFVFKNYFGERLIRFQSVFLAHLSRRLIWWAYKIGRPLSSVVVRRRPSSSSSTLFKHLLLRHHWANQSQTSDGLLWDGGTKVCSNVPGHMTKMAAMPKYGKNLKKSSSLEPKSQWPWILVCNIGCSGTTKFALMMTLSWPWPILRQGQIWFLMLCMGKK